MHNQCSINFQKASDLIHGSLKRSKSYHTHYGEKTFEELSKLAKLGDQKAKQMIKLIKDTPRLMKKSKG